MIFAVVGAAILYGQTQTSADAGETIYRMRCGGCHGLDGRAQTAMGKRQRMRDLTSPEVQKQTDADLRRIIANGKAHMPAYEMILGNDGINAVVAYIREIGR